MYSFRRRCKRILFNQSLVLDDIKNINIVITRDMKTLERLGERKKKSQCYIDRIKLQRNLSCSDW